MPQHKIEILIDGEIVFDDTTAYVCETLLSPIPKIKKLNTAILGSMTTAAIKIIEELPADKHRSFIIEFAELMQKYCPSLRKKSMPNFD